MKKFALAVVVIAFGALMVAGCPADNKTNTTKGNDAPKTNEAPANS